MKRQDTRHGERGTVAVLAAVLLFVLFSFTALAVDVGYLYTRSRMIHAVADSAVFVGMKDLMSGASNSTITSDVNDIATQYGGAYTITALPSATQVQVTVTATYPLFFAKILGLPSKTVTVVAVGTKGTSPPPILATGAGCGTGGVNIAGQAPMTVNGDIQSNGPLNFGTGPPGPIINGNALSECGPTPVTKNAWDTVTGTYGTGGPFTDPFNPYTLPTCDFGSTTTPYTIGFLDWDTTTTPPTLPPGVYCSNAPLLQVNSPGTAFTATNVTLIDIGGEISFNATDASSITPNPKSPNGIVAYSTLAGDCSTPAIFLGGPALGLMTVGGAFYAPNGCVNVQQNGPMNMTSVVGNSVSIANSASQPWTIGAVGGGGGTAWQMSQ